MTTPSWTPLPEPPKGAPNILLILTDDVGFGAASTFGGPVPTPNLDRLSSRGLRYTNFNTTAMCSPTRAALLSGRNHHAMGFGAITEMQAGYPGYNNEFPADSRLLPEILHRAGYSTAMFGKVHLAPDWTRAMTSSHRQWPTKLGFDYFYGFLAADSDQWRPTLIRGVDLTPEPSGRPELLDKRLADDAIRWLHQQKADYPDKPFMIYYATGSLHAPQQAPGDWIARFRGRFDGGWDALREQTVARQKAQGILPKGASVTPRPSELQAWSTLSEADRQRYARYMEVAAAQLAYQDAQIGRILDELDRMGQADNTVVVFMEGDNGASAEGGPDGTPSEMRKLFQDTARATPAEAANLDRLGGPQTYELYQAGWAWAMNSPFPLFKQDASHLGGTRNGMVISWPKGIKAPGRSIARFEHVTDIAPTLLKITGIAMPTDMDGVAQTPMTGVSLDDTFTQVATPRQDRTQYFEMAGNRALYQNGWWANTLPGRMPWQAHTKMPADQFTWQLFNLNDDPAQAHDLSGQMPAKLAAMKAEFDVQASKFGVYPMRASADVEELRMVARPLPTRTDWVFWGSDVHLPWTAQPDLQRGSFTIDADIDLPNAGDGHGTILATGSLLAGWALRLDKGVPVLVHAATEAAADRFSVRGSGPLPAGKHHVTVTFAADTPVLASGGQVSMSVDGKRVGQAHFDRRAFRPIATNELFDIGMDTGVPVVDDGKGWQRFGGAITKVAIHTQ